MSQHDVVLEAVLVVAAVAADERAASAVAASGLARALEEVWRDKSDDAEIVLQLLWCYRRLCAGRDAHDGLLRESRVLLDVLDCVGHANPAVARQADLCLDVVVEHDRDPDGGLGELGAQVRRRRFHAHNREWLEVVDHETGAPDRHNYPSPTASDDESASPARQSPGYGDYDEKWGDSKDTYDD